MLLMQAARRFRIHAKLQGVVPDHVEGTQPNGLASSIWCEPSAGTPVNPFGRVYQKGTTPQAILVEKDKSVFYKDM